VRSWRDSAITEKATCDPARLGGLLVVSESSIEKSGDSSRETWELS
jgi:hypothetical protein